MTTHPVSTADPIGHTVITKLVHWLVFSVIISLLPLIFNLITMIIYAWGPGPSLLSISSRGELMLVSAGIAAKGIGELFASGRKKLIAKYVAGGGCVVVLVLSSMSFVYISTASGSGVPLDAATRISQASAIMLGFTMLASGSCVALSEVRQ